MNKHQRSKIDMYRLLKAWLESVPPAILLLMPHFSLWFSSWSNYVTQLFAIIDDQNRIRLGFAQSKAGIKVSLIDSISELSAVLMSFATYSENLILYNLANYPESNLKKASDELLISISNIIYGLSIENLAELSDYGITALTMNNVQDLINSFIAAKPTPKEQIFVKKEDTVAIKELFKNAGVFLKKLDGCVRFIKRLQPQFRNDYFTRRKIQGPDTILLAGRGKVTNAAGAIMPFVRMTCETLNINRMVSLKGAFNIKEATEGFHDINFAFPGYETTVHRVRFYPNIRAEVNVIMQLHQ